MATIKNTINIFHTSDVYVYSMCMHMCVKCEVSDINISGFIDIIMTRKLTSLPNVESSKYCASY